MSGGGRKLFWFAKCHLCGATLLPRRAITCGKCMEWPLCALSAFGCQTCLGWFGPIYTPALCCSILSFVLKCSVNSWLPVALCMLGNISPKSASLWNGCRQKGSLFNAGSSLRPISQFSFETHGPFVRLQDKCAQVLPVYVQMENKFLHSGSVFTEITWRKKWGEAPIVDISNTLPRDSCRRLQSN